MCITFAVDQDPFRERHWRSRNFYPLDVEYFKGVNMSENMSDIKPGDLVVLKSDLHTAERVVMNVGKVYISTALC